MSLKRPKMNKLQSRLRARERKRLAKQNNELPKISVAEHRVLDVIRVNMHDFTENKLKLRTSIRDYINVVGEKKARFDKPRILLRKLGIEKNAEDMSYLYKLIRAVYLEYSLNLKAGEVPYSVLAALPKRNFLEIWESANELKEDRPYPSEKDIAKAKENAKKISYDESEAKLKEYLKDITDESEDESSEHKDKVTPNLRQTLLDLSRDSIDKTETILYVFKYLEKTDLYKILTIKENFTSTKIDKMINKLMKGHLIVIRSQPNLAASEVTEVSELYEEDIDLLEHSL